MILLVVLLVGHCLPLNLMTASPLSSLKRFWIQSVSCSNFPFMFVVIRSWLGLRIFVIVLILIFVISLICSCILKILDLLSRSFVSLHFSDNHLCSFSLFESVSDVSLHLVLFIFYSSRSRRTSAVIQGFLLFPIGSFSNTDQGISNFLPFVAITMLILKPGKRKFCITGILFY